MASEHGPKVGASPYSTGGGGTVLEHRYGAILLSQLLGGDPVPELGDDVVPVSIRFQDSNFSPIDDLIVIGRTADGRERRVSIGVRRAPQVTESDTATAKLLGSYLRVVTEDWDEVRTGRWRLTLAVASPNRPVQQLQALAEIARHQPSEDAFRSAVATPGRTSGSVRDRLRHLDALIAKAAEDAPINESDIASNELTWRLLYGLRTRELRLEGSDEADRTNAITRLRSAVPDDSVHAATSLFDKLEHLSDRYAPAAATVTPPMLRRDLSGTSINRCPSHATAWRIFETLADGVKQTVDTRLADASAQLELARAEQRSALISKMTAAGASASALVITGEPDVGKPALTLKATEQLMAQGSAVLILNLRHVPETLVEFERLLGDRLEAVFGGSAAGSARLLVIDGAEALLEGRQQFLIRMASAAMTAGLGVAAVTRTDGAGPVTEALSRASSPGNQSGASPETVSEYTVPQLTSSEIDELLAAFPRLARWADDERAASLLARPGLIDMVLRAGPSAVMPDGPVSEADLFAVVWKSLVRRDETMPPGGPSPDARQQALVALARRELLPHDRSMAPDSTALPSLRSDGLLRSADLTMAWSSSDQFASDLVRDMSVVRLLVTDGVDLLTAAGAPRWSLRAARIACQARLLHSSDIRPTLGEMRSQFASLAAQHGQRWDEVPWEALLSLGQARERIHRVWPDLLADKRAGLRVVLRLALQRYTRHGIGNPIILAPLVELAFGTDADDGHDYAERQAGESIREVVLAWLRGLINTTTDPLPLRARVRDQILTADPPMWDEFAVEALATLGPDLNDNAQAFLTRLVADGLSRLDPAVERYGPARSMAAHQPDLLLALAESYYIDRPDPSDDPFGDTDFHDFSGGIRDHRAQRGVGARQAVWYYGPFWDLLTTRPLPALAFINRMLDHAAAVRVRNRDAPDARTLDTLPGVDLDMPGAGTRHCVGDEHVWSWYRGSSVGPRPCTSALLAVERYADQLVTIADIPPARVVEILLRDCHNLAMPGLVVGFLVRHLERCGNRLDRWLAEPHVWQLEFSRTSAEGHLHVQGPDPEDLVGRHRRRHSMRDVAAEMTLRAIVSADQHRLRELNTVRNDLVQRAEDLLGEKPHSAGQDDLLSVQTWAEAFSLDNYIARTDN